MVSAPQDGPDVSVRPGSGVSARLGSGTKEKGGRRDLQIKVSARPYHLLQGPKPDLVIGEHLARECAQEGGGSRGSQLLPALPWSTGFNSGFGLKDTWLSSLPRLQVGKGAEGNFSHLLPSPCSFPESLCFSSICSTDLGGRLWPLPVPAPHPASMPAFLGPRGAPQSTTLAAGEVPGGRSLSACLRPGPHPSPSECPPSSPRAASTAA